MTDTPDDSIAYFEKGGSQWLWCVDRIESGELGDDDAVYFGEVFSPIVPEGEWGTFTQKELDSVGAQRAEWAEDD